MQTIFFAPSCRYIVTQHKGLAAWMSAYLHTFKLHLRWYSMSTRILRAGVLVFCSLYRQLHWHVLVRFTFSLVLPVATPSMSDYWQISILPAETRASHRVTSKLIIYQNLLFRCSIFYVIYRFCRRLSIKERESTLVCITFSSFNACSQALLDTWTRLGLLVFTLR